LKEFLGYKVAIVKKGKNFSSNKLKSDKISEIRTPNKEEYLDESMIKDKNLKQRRGAYRLKRTLSMCLFARSVLLF
jgi:hypothetical protein